MIPAFRIFYLAVFCCMPAFAQPGVDEATQRIRIALRTEPPNLNSLRTTDGISSFVLNHIMEGLLQYDVRNELIGGVAERWQLREDGATFWLRRDARWSDGKPVTARDFVFAWREVLRPATASGYAFALFPVKNAQRINRGEVPAEQLGVKAVDDYQLDVQFERPCPYFLGLTAFVTYYPLREDFLHARGARYAADASDLLFNGPFLLTRWDHGAHLTLQKNPGYWNAGQIRLREIDIPYITGDAASVFNLFQDGSIALAQLEVSTLQEAVAQGMPMQLFNTGGLYYFEFNLRPERLTANVHLRRAIQALFAPEQLTNKVIGLPGSLPTASIFPRTIKGVNASFAEEFPPSLPLRSVAIARRELALAQRELGIRQWPPLVLLARNRTNEKNQAEYLQQLLQKGLGIPVRIDIQIFKQAHEKQMRGDFDISMTIWLPDFDDAITFGDLLASWNANNHGRYKNDRYDALVAAANATGDQSKRMPLFAQMQQIVIDDVPLLPTFEYSEMYAVNPQLRGVTRALFGGDLDFRHSYVEAPSSKRGQH